MRYCLIWFINFCILFSTNGQTYLNKRFTFGYFETGLAVLQDSDLYVANIVSSPSAIDLQQLRIVSFDTNGNVVWNKNYQSSTASYYGGLTGSLVKTYDDGFIIGGGIEDTTGFINDDATIFRFDSTGDTLWTRTFGDSLFQTFYQCKQTMDSGIICCGVTSTYDVFGDVLLVRTDKNGDLLWQKHFGILGKEEEGWSVTETSDGGFLIGGERYTSANHNGEFILIKTDSLGTIQWQRFHGGPWEESCFGVMQASNGNLIACGDSVSTDSSSNGGYPLGQPFFVAYDLQGNLIWQRTYGPIRFLTWVYNVVEYSPGFFISCGLTYDDSAFHALGLVIRFDSLGDSLFYNTYRNIYGHESGSILCNIETTADKGFIGIGVLDPYPPDTGYQDTWLLKLDSMGCDTENCWMVLNNKAIDKDNKIFVFPNPFVSEVNINMDLPEGTKTVDIVISDAIGKTLFQKKMHASLMQLQTSIEDLNLYPGMYYISLYCNGIFQCSKNIVKFK